MEEWTALRGNVLDELHRLDGCVNDLSTFEESEPSCVACGEDLPPLESYRCTDCIPQPYFCKSCMVSAHLCEPFHRVEVR